MKYGINLGALQEVRWKRRGEINKSGYTLKLLYAAETLCMTQKQEEDLRIAERKIMRTILGPIRMNEHEYRRTNEELAQEMEINIVRRIEQLRAI